MSSLNLKEYAISPDTGFLPPQPPVQVSLPAVFRPLEQIAARLPKWLVSGRLRQVVAHLPEVAVAEVDLDEMQLRRVMLLYAYLTHAYVWGEPGPAPRLPRNLAVPFHAIAQGLGRPPVLSYASYALDNWARLDQTQPLELGNLIICQNFLGGLDEDWFILIHIDIEAKAAPALAVIPTLLEAITQENRTTVLTSLEVIRAAWTRINATMDRMPEACDPYIYYHRVRPYLYGWKDNPALPQGLIYEGVEEYGGQPQLWRGETGAQSAIVPTMDALFNVAHDRDRLWDYLIEMRTYMPPQHRAWIAAVEEQSTLRQFVQNHPDARLRQLYNDCLRLIEQFRTRHLEFAARYINQQAVHASNNPDIGTGGTPFMRYLKKHRDESSDHLLQGREDRDPAKS
jgi:indoleamine 2,3-dioxygenase